MVTIATLELSELLRKRRKRLNCGLHGKDALLILSVNVGGSREVVEWALEQDCTILRIQEHRVMGNALKGVMHKAAWKGWTGDMRGSQDEREPKWEWMCCNLGEGSGASVPYEGWKGGKVASRCGALAKRDCPTCVQHLWVGSW